MAPERVRFLRDNAFLVAAVALPLVVIAFFLVATAIPRWLVPPPAHDLLFRATDASGQPNARVDVDFAVRDGKVVATVRSAPANYYGSRPRLFLFDHTTMSAREIAVELPDDLGGDSPRVVAIDALAGRQVLAGARAPDGYQFESGMERGPGIVGGLFGMNRYGPQASLVNRGRVIPISVPAPYQNVYSTRVQAIGWLVDNGQP
jgi:hypothetical protein